MVQEASLDNFVYHILISDKMASYWYRNIYHISSSTVMKMTLVRYHKANFWCACACLCVTTGTWWPVRGDLKCPGSIARPLQIPHFDIWQTWLPSDTPIHIVNHCLVPSNESHPSQIPWTKIFMCVCVCLYVISRTWRIFQTDSKMCPKHR